MVQRGKARGIEWVKLEAHKNGCDVQWYTFISTNAVQSSLLPKIEIGVESIMDPAGIFNNSRKALDQLSRLGPPIH